MYMVKHCQSLLLIEGISHCLYPVVTALQRYQRSLTSLELFSCDARSCDGTSRTPRMQVKFETIDLSTNMMIFVNKPSFLISLAFLAT